VCTSAERFYVLAPVFEEFVERLVEETGGRGSETRCSPRPTWAR
jgi:acyl-CoA reductase-like NAD-dependent aldehyde dehydrogenase